MKAVKKVATVIVSVILWMIILLAALFAFTTLATKDQSQVASVAGFTPMVVKTDSMAPTFDAGDLIMIRKCDTAQLQEGDIVCFHTIIENEYALNTHRIFKIEETGGVRSYTTKGDNNAISDQHVIADGDIVGKYVGRLPKMGKVMDFLSSSIGFLAVIVLPMLLFFIYQVYHLVMVTISLKKAMAVEEAEQRIAAEEKAAQMQYAGPGPMMAPQGVQMAGPGQPVPQQMAGPGQPAPQGAQMAGPGQPVPQQMAEPGQPVPPQDTQTAEQVPPQEQSATQETQQMQSEADAILAEAQRIRAQAEATKARAEAEAALAEAKRMKAEAEAELAKVNAAKTEEDKSK